MEKSNVKICSFLVGFIFCFGICSGAVNYGLLSGKYGVTYYPAVDTKPAPETKPVELETGYSEGDRMALDALMTNAKGKRS